MERSMNNGRNNASTNRSDAEHAEECVRNALDKLSKAQRLALCSKMYAEAGGKISLRDRVVEAIVSASEPLSAMQIVDLTGISRTYVHNILTDLSRGTCFKIARSEDVIQNCYVYYAISEHGTVGDGVTLIWMEPDDTRIESRNYSTWRAAVFGALLGALLSVPVMLIDMATRVAP